MGALLFVRTGASGVLFTPEDVATLEELSHRAAAALENAALFRESQERLAEATRAREEVARLLSEKESAALAQRAFLRDVLRSVSEGRLRLCDSASEVPGPLPRAVCTPLTLTAPTLRDLRRRAEDAAQGVGLSHGRCADLILAAGEAGMNAVVHAGGGQATVTCDPGAGLVQVRVDDCGKGIAEAMLHRATLERGFSTGGTLGHGFLLMISAADRVYLLTGPEGTTVVIEQGRAAPLELEGW